MNNKINKKDIKSFLFLSFFMAIILGVILFIAIYKKNNEQIIETTTIEIKEIGDDFLYYNGFIYYNNRNLCIINESDVGTEIGTVKYHLMYNDIKDNSFIYYNDNEIYAYALEEGTQIFKHKSNNNIILVPTKHNYHNYYVYTKEKTISEFHDFEYYLSNPDKIDSIKFVSYGDTEIPLNLSINDFKENIEPFSISSYIDGFMAYYLLIEENGLYTKYESTGNMFMNIILLNIDNTQYIYENSELSNMLIEMFSKYFE